jgi:hypothetical protein
MTSETMARVRAYLKARPGRNAKNAQKSLSIPGLTMDMIRKIQAELGSGKPAPAIPVTAAPKTLAKPIRLLREEFDDVGKVRRFMSSLGKADYIDDPDLRRQLHISDPRWREVRGHESLAPYQFLLPNRRIVWMHEEAQVQLKAAIELSSP